MSGVGETEIGMEAGDEMTIETEGTIHYIHIYTLLYTITYSAHPNMSSFNSFLSLIGWLCQLFCSLFFFLSLSLTLYRSLSPSLSFSHSLFLSLSLFPFYLACLLIYLCSLHVIPLQAEKSFLENTVQSPLTECTASYHLLQCGREKTGRNGTKQKMGLPQQCVLYVPCQYVLYVPKLKKLAISGEMSCLLYFHATQCSENI